MLRRWIPLLLVAVMLSGVLAACGDDDDDDSDEVGAAGTPTPSPTVASSDILPSTPTEPLPSGADLVIPPEIPEGVRQEGRTLGDPNAPVAVVEYGDFL